MGSNPTGGIDVHFECCVLSGKGLCDELITLPAESYRVWCNVVSTVQGNFFFTGSSSDSRHSSVLHFQRKHFVDKQLHSFRPTENWSSFHPLTYVNPHFLDIAWRELNTEIRCTLWQISGCDCRQLYQISKWCVHQNSLLIRHTEKLTHRNLFCFVEWLNWQRSFIAVLSTSKKKRAYGILSLFCYVAYTAN